jgi:hypothetical protein
MPVNEQARKPENMKPAAALPNFERMTKVSL